MFALILDGKVVQVAPREFETHRDLTWVNISRIAPMPEAGWRYDGNAFTPPGKPAWPTSAEQVDDEIAVNPAMRGLVRSLAKRLGTTPAKLIAEIKAEVDR